MNLFNVNSWNIDCFLCRFNYLNISDGNHLIGHYCGNLTGKVIFVSRDYLVLTFHSNENFDPNKKGFEIFFTDDVNMPGKWIQQSSINNTLSILACVASVSTRVSWGVGRERKKRRNNGGGQRRKRLPSPFHFFPSRSSVRAIPRLETLATQAMSIYIRV